MSAFVGRPESAVRHGILVDESFVAVNAAAVGACPSKTPDAGGRMTDY